MEELLPVNELLPCLAAPPPQLLADARNSLDRMAVSSFSPLQLTNQAAAMVQVPVLCHSFSGSMFIKFRARLPVLQIHVPSFLQRLFPCLFYLVF